MSKSAALKDSSHSYFILFVPKCLWVGKLEGKILDMLSHLKDFVEQNNG
jgi:hypothetical protein